MFAIATLMALVQQVSGTPYISGGDSPAGTDCSGLASWVSNMATGRPVYGDRFNTGNQERALLARGFKYGSQPGALVIGWNSGHTAVTLPDGTPVSSGEGGHGVRIGGGGAYQRQFTHHMYLPVEAAAPPDAPADAPLPFGAPPPPPAPINPMAAPAPVDPFAPPPPADPMAAPAPMDPFAPPPPADAIPPAPMDGPAPIVLDVPPPPAPPAPGEPAPVAI
ncbi:MULTISPECIES: glycoside hydrolase [Mycobacterium]|uniref:Glycoside hydrolase n=1 Tax=Mycobacterium syngnathidarum TaxID=1908205 RepID=A0A1Q9WBT1_9MYCO|nr:MULTISPECIES: glycoside hydrolase [Mycobacterium]MCG7610529.1 C40 family peptidase [Mycobacterium sp. CnD-18-1]OHT97814.1 glycoside hydrolase [Mycobacterium syngnathidarum]OLT96139.1 glycoside hydrolase [Mycobacterium syngnathidarum]